MSRNQLYRHEPTILSGEREMYGDPLGSSQLQSCGGSILCLQSRSTGE